MGPRPLDLDILLFGDKIIDTPELVVPHPRIKERAFVLVPLLEIWPRACEPGSGAGYAVFADSLPPQGIYYHTVMPL